jgi:hypothetical protein
MALQERGIQVMLPASTTPMPRQRLGAQGSPILAAGHAIFLRDNGGPCADRFGFWTVPTARKWVRMKLRYNRGPLGRLPSLMCWELLERAVFDPKIRRAGRLQGRDGQVPAASTLAASITNSLMDRT